MKQASLIPPSSVRSFLESKPEAILLDVRTPGEFAGRHAEGAVNIPLDAITRDAFSLPSPLSKEAPICILCEKGGRAAIAAEHLLKAGCREIHVVEGGTQAWVTEGLPVVSLGRGSMSIERQVRIGAGTLVLLGVVLGFLVHPGFFFLSGFVGAGLVFAGVTDWCGMGLLLARAPWNR